jgi:hypothetical protein
MRRFHHVGIITDEQQPGEIYIVSGPMPLPLFW